MLNQRLSAIALNALKDALCQIYWYKNDLRSFFENCITDKSVIYSVEWGAGNYKRQIVSDIINLLAGNQEKYLGDIRRIINEVCQFENFKHLEKLEDGEKKAHQAKSAVQVLKEIVHGHDKSLKENESIIRRRQEMEEKKRLNNAMFEKLDEIKDRYFKLVTSKEPHKRGFELEKVLYELFALYDLDPKASFRNVGEQIDGAFSLEGTDYLFEAKWTSGFTDIGDLDSFSGKVKRKLDNTLGVFLSINGFSEDAVYAHSIGRSSILLMEGRDLVAVLEGRIDFVTMLIRKRRHAAQTGEILYKAFLDD